LGGVLSLSGIKRDKVQATFIYNPYATNLEDGRRIESSDSKTDSTIEILVENHAKSPIQTPNSEK